MFEVGSLLRIRGKTTTPHGNVTTVEQQSGSFEGRLSPNGNRKARVLFYGFTENVSDPRERPIL